MALQISGFESGIEEGFEIEPQALLIVVDLLQPLVYLSLGHVL